MRLRSVEWGRGVSAIHSQIESNISHLVLPDLPGVDLDERRFFKTESSSCKKVATIAAGRHTLDSFDARIHELLNSNIHDFLIVGGNEKMPGHISTLTAISRAKSYSPNIWCVANPNDSNSITTLEEKLNSGAQAVLTQPILSSVGLETLQQYPSSNSLLIGVAFPKSVRGIRFWLELLGQPELQEDSLFLSYEEDVKLSKCIASRQTALIENESFVDGFHFMPLRNTRALLHHLQNLKH